MSQTILRLIREYEHSHKVYQQESDFEAEKKEEYDELMKEYYLKMQKRWCWQEVPKEPTMEDAERSALEKRKQAEEAKKEKDS